MKTKSMKNEGRIIKGQKCLGPMNTVVVSKHLSRKAKERIYATMAKPTMTYKCDTWKANPRNSGDVGKKTNDENLRGKKGASIMKGEN